MWYHVSPAYLGNIVTLTPKMPECAIEDNEGNIPRICVSDTVFKCLRAINGRKNLHSSDCLTNYKENPCVYYTEETPYLPPNWGDFRYNSEMWFIHKTTFFYLARVDFYKLFKYNKLVSTDDKKLKLPKKDKEIVYPVEKFMQSLLIYE